ncbi:MAG: hypothetical protein M3R08_01065 [Bacteroidota bacterium]|nr:hypothetical protein [Bacteroidota bacterium]
MAYTSPFRKCSYCGEYDKPYERERRLRRRAWTQFQTTRKFCCPSCEQKGREDERKARQLILRNHELLRDRLLAEPEAQYQRIKVQYPDAILIFRCNDEYIAFGNDAKTLNGLLGLQLNDSQNGEPFKLQCGFPFHSLEDYLPRMVRAGHRVAICDKFEGIYLPAPLEREKEGEAAPSMVCEPYDDPPFAKTHRITVRGQVEPVDVHLLEGMYYELDGSWGILTTDWRVDVILTYRVIYAGHSDLSMVADKPSRYERNENSKLAEKLKLAITILSQHGALPVANDKRMNAPASSQINWELHQEKIGSHLALHGIQIVHGHLKIGFGKFKATFGHEHLPDLLRYYSRVTSGRDLHFKLPPSGAPSRAIGNFSSDEMRQLTLAIAEENMATAHAQPYSAIKDLFDRHLTEVRMRVEKPLLMDLPPVVQHDADEEDAVDYRALDQYEEAA